MARPRAQGINSADRSSRQLRRFGLSINVDRVFVIEMPVDRGELRIQWKDALGARRGNSVILETWPIWSLPHQWYILVDQVPHRPARGDDARSVTSNCNFSP